MTAAPIRVERKGWFKAWLQPTREQLRRACSWAEAEARTSTWLDAGDLVIWLNWAIGEQLGVHVVSRIIGWHDVNDAPVIRIDIQDYTHHIAITDTRIDDGFVETKAGAGKDTPVAASRGGSGQSKSLDRFAPSAAATPNPRSGKH